MTDTPRSPTLYLFVSGEPYDDAVSSGRTRAFSAAFASGPAGAVSWGGQQPSDFEPGQVYGPDARIGRMVLGLARKHGISIQVIDVNHPEGNADLIRRYLHEDDVFPVLVRPDGGRLVGSESFLPPVVERFLTGP